MPISSGVNLAVAADPLSGSPLSLLEASLRLMSDAVMMVSAAIDHAGPSIVFANQAFADLTGHAADELIGKTPEMVHELGDTDGAIGSLYRRLADDGRYFGNVHGRRKDGSRFTTPCQIIPVFVDEGAIRHWLFIYRCALALPGTGGEATQRPSPQVKIVGKSELQTRVERAVLNANSNGSRHVLCSIDLEPLSGIRESAGRSAVEEFVGRVPDLLAGTFRDRDTLGRISQTVYVLLLENCGVEEALGISDLIVAAFRGHRVVASDRTYPIDASIGLFPIATETESADYAFACVDAARMIARREGAGRIYFWGTGSDHADREVGHIVLQSQLQDALEQNRFVLYGQPIVDISRRNENPCRYEMLLRLRDPRGLLPPSAFIPAAERFGIMGLIDRWVIETAVGRHRDTFGAGSPVEITINLSANSLGDAGLPEFIRQRAERYGIEPQRLCFEIKESAAIRGGARVAGVMDEIRRGGSRVALDDFGAGLSSFANLKSLSADYLKIDGSFVRHITDSTTDAAIVEAINRVGHTLGMETVAECVETEAAVDCLSSIGVDWVQGYALGVPIVLDRLARDFHTL